MTDRPSLVFLDAATFDRGDVGLEAFTDRWSCVFHPTTSSDQVAARIAGHRLVVTNKVVLDAELLASDAARDLEMIAIAATGTNNVDLEAAAARGIAVANVVDYSSEAVAQHSFGLMLELAMHVGAYHRAVVHGEWSRSPTVALLTWPCVELAGRTLGIIGHGAIGRTVERVARGFGMHVLVAGRRGEAAPAAGRTAFEELIRVSDVVSVHCPLTPDTEGLIGSAELASMKSSAFLINTARGGIVDERALIAALEAGEIAGAGFDVLSVEPPALDHPMVEAAARLPQLVVTPHTAWTPIETRQRLLAEIEANITAHLAGERRNRVA